MIACIYAPAHSLINISKLQGSNILGKTNSVNLLETLPHTVCKLGLTL